MEICVPRPGSFHQHLFYCRQQAAACVRCNSRWLDHPAGTLGTALRRCHPTSKLAGLLAGAVVAVVTNFLGNQQYRIYIFIYIYASKFV